MTTYESQQGQSGSGTNGHQQRGDGQGVGQRIDQLNSSAHQLWDEARGAVTDLSASIDLRGRVERNPYGMILAAAGIGYVLGGGLFTPLTGRILRLGVRFAMLPFVKDELIGMAEAAVSGMAREPGQGQAPRNPQGV